jgi:hypothetical protein
MAKVNTFEALTFVSPALSFFASTCGRSNTTVDQAERLGLLRRHEPIPVHGGFIRQARDRYGA